MQSNNRLWTTRVTPRIIKRGDGPELHKGDVVGLLYKIARTEADLVENNILEGNFDDGREIVTWFGEGALCEYIENNIEGLQVGSVILFNIHVDNPRPIQFAMELYLSSIRATDLPPERHVVFGQSKHYVVAQERPRPVLLAAVQNPKKIDAAGHVYIEIRSEDYPKAVEELLEVGLSESQLKPLRSSSSAKREFIVLKSFVDDVKRTFDKL